MLNKLQNKLLSKLNRQIKTVKTKRKELQRVQPSKYKGQGSKLKRKQRTRKK